MKISDIIEKLGCKELGLFCNIRCEDEPVADRAALDESLAILKILNDAGLEFLHDVEEAMTKIRNAAEEK